MNDIIIRKGRNTVTFNERGINAINSIPLSKRSRELMFTPVGQLMAEREVRRRSWFRMKSWLHGIPMVRKEHRITWDLSS